MPIYIFIIPYQQTKVNQISQPNRKNTMKIFKRILQILAVLLIAAVIGYFIFTGCHV